MTAWSDTIDLLIGHLRYRQERGDRGVELDSAVLAALATPPARDAAAGGGHAAAPAPALPAPPRAARAPAPAADLPAPVLPAGTAGASRSERETALAAIAAQAAACRRCGLCESRTHSVPGQGNGCSPDVLFVGEAPGADEDAQGLAFVGAAGQLLTRMIAAMGFDRQEVFIANICKCRPPQNRQPTIDEMNACLPYLRAQLAVIRPRTIVALGGVAIRGLLDTQVGITRLRGQWTRYGDVPLMPTFHPAYLLRYPAAKKLSWDDLKAVLTHLGRPIPPVPPVRPAAPAGS